MEPEPKSVHLEYTSRALIKLRHAARLFESLERQVDAWNEERQLLAPSRSPREGPQRLEIFRPSELDEMPVEAWESTFHDGVHNLRVALDTLCFELCKLEGEKPANPGSIHFPITGHPNEWPERSKHLGTIPAPLLERLREVQSWARPRDEGEPDVLTLISRVDNHDKHRASGVTLDVFPMLQWAIRESRDLPVELLQASEWPLERWMEASISRPLPRGEAGLIPVMAWPYVTFEGLFANIADGQRWLYHQTDRIIAFIASGEWHDAKFEQALPGPAWSKWPQVSELGAPPMERTQG